jgi:hypothetical protein
MAESTLAVGARLKEIATRDLVYRGCTIVGWDERALVFAVERTVADDGGNVETVLSHILVPWPSINYVILSEERA